MSAGQRRCPSSPAGYPLRTLGWSPSLPLNVPCLASPRPPPPPPRFASLTVPPPTPARSLSPVLPHAIHPILALTRRRRAALTSRPRNPTPCPSIFPPNPFLLPELPLLPLIRYSSLSLLCSPLSRCSLQGLLPQPCTCPPTARSLCEMPCQSRRHTAPQAAVGVEARGYMGRVAWEGDGSQGSGRVRMDGSAQVMNIVRVVGSACLLRHACSTAGGECCITVQGGGSRVRMVACWVAASPASAERLRSSLGMSLRSSLSRGAAAAAAPPAVQHCLRLCHRRRLGGDADGHGVVVGGGGEAGVALRAGGDQWCVVGRGGCHEGSGVQGDDDGDDAKGIQAEVAGTWWGCQVGEERQDWMQGCGFHQPRPRPRPHHAPHQAPPQPALLTSAFAMDSASAQPNAWGA